MPAKLTREPVAGVTGAAESSRVAGRTRTSGTPESTCSLGSTSTEVIVPAKGARSVDSIFIASATIRGSPSATSWPGATAMETMSAGHWARTAMPSSRSTRWAMPSISRRHPVPCEAMTTWRSRPAAVTVHSKSLARSIATSATASPESIR